MARKTIRVSDISGAEIPDGSGRRFVSRSQMRVEDHASSTSPTPKQRNSGDAKSPGAAEDPRTQAKHHVRASSRSLDMLVFPVRASHNLLA
jgi:hypothetical protein